MSRSFARIVTAAGILALASCSGRLVLDEGQPPDGGDSGPAPDSGDSGPTPPSCVKAPGPPEGTDLGDGAEPFVVAFSLFDFGDEAGPDGGRNRLRDIGFDLDGECTDQRETSCTRPYWATGDVTDGPRGADNSLAKIIQYIHELIPRFGSQSFTQAIQNGLTTVLLRISDYNGQADDDSIRVDVFVPAPMAAFPGAPRQTPLWDGEDMWPVASDSVANNDINQPNYASTSGYVSNYMMVANVEYARVRVTTALTESVLSTLEMGFVRPLAIAARIERQANGRYALRDGTLAGKWPVGHFISQLGQFADPIALSTGQVVPLCPPATYHEIFRDNICELVDLIVDPQGATTECDAISVGIGFEALPARLGDVFEVRNSTNPCPPDRDPGTPEYFCGRPIVRVDAGTAGASGR